MAAIGILISLKCDGKGCIELTIEIFSNQNTQYKEWKKLQRKKYRNKNKLFLIEGIKMIEEAIYWESSLEAILYSEKLFEVNGGKDLYKRISQKGVPIYKLEHILLKELCFTETPQGIIAIVQQPQYLVEDFISEKDSSIIILEELQDPGNLGTIIRTADAAGFDTILLSKGCVDLYNDKVLRSTMGSIFHLSVIQDLSLEQVIPKLIEEHYQVIGASLNTDEYYHQIKYSSKKALIIGNEAHGISKTTAKLCTDLVKIPILGNAESLNAAIAAGILMYKMQGI